MTIETNIAPKTKRQLRRSFGGEEYIELYKQHSENIKKNSAAILNRGRDEAFQLFEDLRFPSTYDEDYKYSDFKELVAIDYGLNINRVEFPVNPYDVFKCDVPGISENLYFVVNDGFYPVQNGSKAKLPDGVVICSMREASEKYPDLMDKHYDRIVKKHKDNFIAFNGSFAQDGFFMYVPENVQLSTPIQIINVMRSDVDFMANSRNLVIVENGAKAQLLICDHTMDDVRFFSNRVTEVYVGENAVYEHYKLENVSMQTVDVSSLLVDQQASSNVLTNLVTVHNGVTRNNVKIELNGENAETLLCGMTLSDKNQVLDNHTTIYHNVPNCHSDELFKYILDDDSKAGFTGRLYIEKDAQKTLAYQNNKNLLLSKTANVRTRPQLEIFADDVKCSHGATIGQLDEVAMFYMQQRGISKKEARQLLMYAFTADVVDNIKIDALHDRIKMLVEKRLRGELDRHQGCNLCKPPASRHRREE